MSHPRRNPVWDLRSAKWQWRGSWVQALVLLGIIISIAAWPVMAQPQIPRDAGSSSSGDDDSERPGEEEENDSADGEPAANLMLGRSARETFRGRSPGRKCELAPTTAAAASMRHSFGKDRDAAAFSSARRPLRC